MKKLLCVAICAVIFVSFSATATETFDVTQYSDAELLDIYTTIGNELTARNVFKSAEIYQGIYTAGKDIPAGDFKFEYADDPDNCSAVTYYIYKSQEDLNANKHLFHDSVYESGGEAMIHLDEGDLLVITGTARLTVAAITWE